MAAGTLLVFEQADARLPTPATEAHRASGLDAAGAEIVAELLERWPALQPEARVRLARQVLTRYGGELGQPGYHDDVLHTRPERLARAPSRAGKMNGSARQHALTVTLSQRAASCGESHDPVRRT